MKFIFGVAEESRLGRGGGRGKTEERVPGSTSSFLPR